MFLLKVHSELKVNSALKLSFALIANFTLKGLFTQKSNFSPRKLNLSQINLMKSNRDTVNMLLDTVKAAFIIDFEIFFC